MTALVLEILAQIRKRFNMREKIRFWWNLALKRLNRNILLQIVLKLLPYVMSLLALGIIMFAEEEGEEEEEEELDEEAFFQRLSPSAREALSQADGIRIALGQDKVHMEHLIVGLLKKKGGPTERLLGKAGIDATNFSEVVETVLPKEGSYTPSQLTALPPTSKHVEKALIVARQVAGLQESDPIRSRHILYGALSIADCHVIQALVNQGGIRKENIDLATPPSQAKTASHPVIAGFDSDVPDGEDLLGVTKEVEALCSVLVARAVEPPLSLGLFGDWGSGKSFFMRMMEKRIEQLKEASQHAKGDTAFCTNIVQLKFNAWYYIDTTNLWSSLTSAIFEGLARALLKKDDVDSEYKRARLLANTIKSRDELANAEREKNEADAKLLENQQRLSELERYEATIEASLTPQAIIQGAWRIALRQPEVPETIEETKKKLSENVEKAAKALNYTTTDAMKAELKTQLLELRGIWGTLQALAIAIRNAGVRQGWLWFVLGVAFISLTLALVLALLFVYRAYLIGALGSVVGLLLGIIVTLAPFIPAVRRALSLIKQAQEESTKLVEEERQRRQKEVQPMHEELQREVADAQQRLEKAQQRLEKASAEVRGNEQEMEALRADPQMSDFIKQRQASNIYTKHLSVIAQVREDFEKLSFLLAKEKKDAEKGTPAGQEEQLLPRIDRIILYIDDLDRCPEDQVVKVLQAVHLLLAFPLFIVVVGVDSRWLLHSLKQHSSAFQSKASERDGIPNEEQTHWQSTPLNYLEKIFQIPFTLRPMKVTGFNRLVDTLATERNGEQIAGKGTSGDKKEPKHPLEAELPGVGGKPAEKAKQDEPAKPVPTISMTPIDLHPGFLEITEWERAVMKKLFRFIPSPRAAKRFINVYRLLRASVDDHKLQKFIGDENGGQHRAMLLLLAILIGYPTEATEMLRELLEREHTETWQEFIDSFKKRMENKERMEKQNISPERTTQDRVSQAEADSWQKLKENLESDTVRLLVPEDQSCADFVECAPHVARYSFQSGRVLIAQRSVDTDR